MVGEETTLQTTPEDAAVTEGNGGSGETAVSDVKPQKITPPKGFRLLNQEVEGIPERFRSEWLKAYDLAIKSGEIEAVVISQEFEVKVGGKHRTRPDEAIFDRPAYLTWAKAALHQLEKSHAKGKLRVAVSLEELASGKVDLTDLANQNREMTKRTVQPSKHRAGKRQASAKEASQGQRKSRTVKGNGNA